MASSPIPSATRGILHQLQAQIRQCEQRDPAASARVVSTGCAALDRILPAGGLRQGTLVEWLADQAGSGASLLAVATAQQARADRRRVIVVDRRRCFHPLPALALGIPPAHLVIVHPESVADERWAIDQALRCGAVGAVVAWPEQLDGRTFRRLQLASEKGGTIGCLVRPAAARSDPTWAEVRLLVRPRSAQEARQIEVELIHSRGGRAGGVARLFLDELSGASHETPALRVAPELADPTLSSTAERASSRGARAV